MKTLYQIKAPYTENDIFYWADNEEQALELAHQQGLDRNIKAVAERVWANNISMEYRGYVIKD